jgi:hypothetical protein
MSIAFPDYVTVSVNGYEEQHGKIALRTDMDRGVPKQRRIQSDVLITLPLKLIFSTAANAAAFEDWFYNDAQAGMTWFEWTDPRTDVVRQARCVANTLGPLARMPDAADFNLTTRTLQIEYRRAL